MNLEWLKTASIGRAYLWIALPILALVAMRAGVPEVYDVLVRALAEWLEVEEVVR